MCEEGNVEIRGSDSLVLEVEEMETVKRALVVDRNTLARSAVVILLQRNGWEVIGAADGAEALMLAGAWHFDLVLTDPDPSKVPGLQLVRLLKGNLLSRLVPVILLVEERQWVGEVGNLADDVIVKNDAIEKHLKRKLADLFEESPAEWAPNLSTSPVLADPAACQISG
jgi:CheY-like chemotaxis protein